MPRGIYPREPKAGDGSDVMILSIKLASGRFEMTLQHPFKPGMTEDHFRDSIDAWLAMSIQALRSGVTAFDAELKEPPPSTLKETT